MAPTARSLTEAEKSACIALSTLFLDSEMTLSRVDDMARFLHRLRMPVDQLDNILRNDVFPILYPNLMTPAGVWDSFDESDLINRVADRRCHPPGVVQKLGSSAAWTFLAWSVTSPWNQVKDRLRLLGQEMPSESSSLFCRGTQVMG
ncbi:hypothetical protein TPAR_06090 [Tolypocladium paradoxum]|uniref:DUF7079 domain-containing protein n=1 Tax=Tolypocladium paradoxum TaxID=94208 RepID=A0A2S4KU81_9HYPO|nr:hypothetical protein TPAR_06090 [Tolypocladium paradoxum]